MRLEETSLHFRRLTPRAARASLHSHRSYVSRCRADYDAARAELETALEIVRANGDALDEARLIGQWGALENSAGDLDRAEQLLETSLEMRLRLREHRGIVLSLTTLALVAARRDGPEHSSELLARARRMADEAADGPSMGGVLLAEAEIHRLDGDPQRAREALEGALVVFYGVTGLVHYASWVHLQHAYLSQEVGDLQEAARRLEIARSGFTESGSAVALERCAVVDARLRALTGC
jgi:tetratricopeptide (TPR) repeat protein